MESYSYSAYGETRKSQSTPTNNPFAYTGREYDAPDLYYYRHRYYDPTNQRFLSKDPLNLASGDFNLYRYVGGDPVNWVDPQGLKTWQLGIGFNVGGLVGSTKSAGFVLAHW